MPDLSPDIDPSQAGDSSVTSLDLLSEPAMTNAYFICHNVQVEIRQQIFSLTFELQDLMFFRGFYWAGTEKKGKGKKKKRQKI